MKKKEKRLAAKNRNEVTPPEVAVVADANSIDTDASSGAAAVASELKTPRFVVSEASCTGNLISRLMKMFESS